MFLYVIVWKSHDCTESSTEEKGNYGKTWDILIQYLSMFRKDYYRVFNDVETKQGE